MPTRTVLSRFRMLGIAALAAGTAALAAPTSATDARQTVLVLYPFSRLLPANLEFDRGFRQGLESHGAGSAELFDASSR